MTRPLILILVAVAVAAAIAGAAIAHRNDHPASTARAFHTPDGDVTCVYGHNLSGDAGVSCESRTLRTGGNINTGEDYPHRIAYLTPRVENGAIRLDTDWTAPDRRITCRAYASTPLHAQVVTCYAGRQYGLQVSRRQAVAFDVTSAKITQL